MLEMNESSIPGIKINKRNILRIYFYSNNKMSRIHQGQCSGPYMCADLIWRQGWDTPERRGNDSEFCNALLDIKFFKKFCSSAQKRADPR